MTENLTNLVGMRDVCFEYAENSPVLHDITCDFHPGEIVYVVGASGCGKSTLAHLLAGVTKPSRGEIKRSDNLKTSLVLQFPEQLFIFETVGEELESLPNSAARHVAADVISRFGLDATTVSDYSPQRLSFAQRRMFATSLLCAQGQDLIILDEPTLGLDRQNMVEFAQWINEIAERGSCCIVMTHDLELISQSSGRVILLKDGRLFWKGPSEEYVQSTPLLREASAI